MSDGVLSVAYRRGKLEAFLRRYRTHLVVPVLGAAAVGCAASLWIASPATPTPAMFVGPLLIAIGLGLLVGLGFAVLRDASNPYVRVARDAAVASGYDVLGVIPSRSRRSSPALVALTDPHTPAAAAYRSLDRHLVAALPNAKNGAVLVAGVRASDNAALTAANLAVAAALDGHSTVLVDLALDAPNLHYLFSVDNNVGIAQVLAGGPLRDAVREIGRVPHLAVIPAGHVDAELSERIDGRRLGPAMDRLRRRFDIVILTATSVLDGAEDFGMPPLCDGVMLVLSSRSSRKSDVTDAANKLDQAHAAVIGTVLTEYRSDLHGPSVSSFDASTFRRNRHRATPSLEPLIPTTESEGKTEPEPAESADVSQPNAWTPPRGQSAPAANLSRTDGSAESAAASSEQPPASAAGAAQITGEIPIITESTHTTMDMPRTVVTVSTAPGQSQAFQPPIVSHRAADRIGPTADHRPSERHLAPTSTSRHGDRDPVADGVRAIPRPMAARPLSATQRRVLVGLNARLAALPIVLSDTGDTESLAPDPTRLGATPTLSNDTRELFRHHEVAATPTESRPVHTDNSAAEVSPDVADVGVARPGLAGAQPVGSPTQSTTAAASGLFEPGGATWLDELNWADAPPGGADTTGQVARVDRQLDPPPASSAAIPPTASVVASAVVVPVSDPAPGHSDSACGPEFDPQRAHPDDTPVANPLDVQAVDDPHILASDDSGVPIDSELPAGHRPSPMGERAAAERNPTSARSRKPATKKAATKRSATKKPTAKKAATKKPATKKATKKTAAKRTTAKKSTARKPAKRTATKKSVAKKSTTKKSAAKKAAAKAAAKKAAAQKSSAKKNASPTKAATKKSAARKTTAKKAAARKPASKKKPVRK